MSAPHTQNQAEDRINYKAIGMVAGISLTLFALGIVWAYTIYDRTRGEPLDIIPERIGTAEIGIVDQLQFNQDMRAEDLRKQKLEKLSSYGWVDPQQNLVHVPVEVAMKRYIETAAAPVPPQAPQAPETAPGEIGPGEGADGAAPAGENGTQPPAENGAEQK